MSVFYDIIEDNKSIEYFEIVKLSPTYFIIVCLGGCVDGYSNYLWSYTLPIIFMPEGMLNEQDRIVVTKHWLREFERGE